MKTANVLICIAIVAAMATPAKAVEPVRFLYPQEDLFMHYSSNVADDNSLLLLDCFTGNDNEYIVLYDMEYDCFWIGPAPMRTYEATYTNNGDSLDITSGDSPDINYSGTKAAGTRVRKQMQIIK